MKELTLSATLGTPHEYIARRIETEYWHHRSEWMEGMLASAVRRIEETFGVGYAARILSANGDGGREAFIANLTDPGESVWASPASRFAIIAEGLGCQVSCVTEASFPATTPAIVLLDHVAPDGALLDLREIVSRIREEHPAALIIADLSASFGADHVDFPALDCDGYLIVPERALGGIPGAVVLVYREAIRGRIREIRSRATSFPFALDLLKYDKAWENVTTPYSPNISSSVALSTALDLIRENGDLVYHAKRHGIFAQIFRSAMAARGAAIMPGNRTNAFTVFRLPDSVSAQDLVTALAEEGIIIDLFPAQKNAILVGHMGFLLESHIARFFAALSRHLPGPMPSATLDIVAAPPIWDPKMRRLFSILPGELITEAEAVAKKHVADPAYVAKIVDSAKKAFQTHQEYGVYGCFSTRTLGFIGAGNTVRESVARLQEAGVKDIIVYSPSLAARKKRGARGKEIDDHRSLEYWEHRHVRVASSAEEVFLAAHTVVLLPTLYTKRALALLKKPKEYYNEHLVDNALLTKVRDHGKMDLLINASAREGLINRAALGKHLKQGWLKFVSDELPPSGDPALAYENSWVTGHIGGSSKLTKQRIAENTHLLLVRFLCEIAHGKEGGGEYRINLINSHAKPAGGWRSEHARAKEIRILLADIFDTATLDFSGIEKKVGAKLVIHDISNAPRSEIALIEALAKHRPQVLMIRTNTLITEQVARAMAGIPECVALIRPGVGIDNIYDGLEILSAAGIKVMNEPYGNSFSVGELTTHLVVNGVQKTLFAPGPTQFKPEVFKVMDAYAAPAAASYRKAYADMLKLLRPWMDRGASLITQSTPSTGLMEAGITNLSKPGERGLIIAHGKFGDRFAQIAKAAGRQVDVLAVADEEWGRAFTPREIAAAFAKDAKRRGETGYRPYSFICFQQNETSSGVAYRQRHIEQIVRAARAYHPEIMIILDGVSGVGAHPLEFSRLDVDLVVIGSQKAFGISSGFTYGALSPRACAYLLTTAGYQGSFDAFRTDTKRMDYLAALEKSIRTRYHSLLRLALEEAEGSDSMPGIFHVLSSLASLRAMEAEGGKMAVIARHGALAAYCRAQVKRMHLSTLSHMPFASDSVTPLLTPKSRSAVKLKKELMEQYGFSVAGSQIDYWKPRLIRIGHVGYVTMPDLVRCMRGIRRLLR